MSNRAPPSRMPTVATTFLVVLAIASTIYAALWWIDFGGTDIPPPPWLWITAHAEDTLVNLGEVIVGILGIALTVVAIIVELAANRYTPRITELFLRDPINGAVLGFFVVTAVLVLWVDLSLVEAHHPHAMVVATGVLMSTSLLLLLPYFVYVFDFLTPQRVIHRIQRRGVDALRRLERRPADLATARRDVTASIEQLGEIALHSVEKHDKAIALAALEALEGVGEVDLALRDRLPVGWYATAALPDEDPDFVALHPTIVAALATKRAWVQMKIQRQATAVYTASLHKMRDVAHMVAVEARRLGAAACNAGDNPSLDLAVKFLNTLLRLAINARDVRTVYHVFNEYRLLAEHAVDQGRGDAALEMAERFKYYGLIGFHAQIAFLLETAAYDLCALLEHAAAAGAPCQDALLDVFLEVDHEPEDDASTQENALRGVRKAQVRLATWYLAHGDVARARRIHADMANEDPARLRSILAELAGIDDPEYWEVSNRGIHFDYLPPDQRAQLGAFAAWFAEELA